MTQRVSARDVAKLAGVSRTTVSFVLNDVAGMRISAQTRARVLEAAHKLNYHPNASARRLVTGQTYILAYVERQDPDRAFADAFLPQVLRGVHDAAGTANYEVLFAAVPLDEGGDRCAALLRGHHVDGIILSGPRVDDKQFQDLLTGSSQVVLQGQWSDLAVPYVDVDNFSSAKLATEHLLRLGHTSLAMIAHADLAYTAARARLEGYQAAVREHGLSSQVDRFVVADFTPASGEDAAEILLRSTPRPSAVFAGSDTVAIGALRGIRRLGLDVPKDVAVVGFDDIPMAVYTDPPLTTVRLPAYGIGWAAAELLIRRIHSEPIQEQHILLETELVIRESCGSSLMTRGAT